MDEKLTRRDFNEAIEEDTIEGVNLTIKDTDRTVERAFTELKEAGIIENGKKYEETIEYMTENGERLALCTIVVFDTVGYISWVWVAEPFRGNGIGTRLVRHSITRLGKRGVERVYTLPKSEGAGAIFSNLSFSNSQEISGWRVKNL